MLLLMQQCFATRNDCSGTMSSNGYFFFIVSMLRSFAMQVKQSRIFLIIWSYIQDCKQQKFYHWQISSITTEVLENTECIISISRQNLESLAKQFLLHLDKFLWSTSPDRTFSVLLFFIIQSLRYCKIIKNDQLRHSNSKSATTMLKQ
jgi:hypothetical protein